MEIIDVVFLIPFCFGIWLAVTTLMGLTLGWYSLARRYPDRPNEVPIVKFLHQSGYMGSLFGNMQGVLKLQACRSGLRVGIMRIFGPFYKDFFVPWGEIKVRRRNFFFIKYAELTFGLNIGKLGIDEIVADRFWRVLPESWPELGNPPTPLRPTELRVQVFLWWLGITTIAAAFFIIVPKLSSPSSHEPRILVAILFPAIVFGLGSLVKYTRRLKINK